MHGEGKMLKPRGGEEVLQQAELPNHQKPDNAYPLPVMEKPGVRRIEEGRRENMTEFQGSTGYNGYNTSKYTLGEELHSGMGVAGEGSSDGCAYCIQNMQAYQPSRKRSRPYDNSSMFPRLNPMEEDAAAMSRQNYADAYAYGMSWPAWPGRVFNNSSMYYYPSPANISAPPYNYSYYPAWGGHMNTYQGLNPPPPHQQPYMSNGHTSVMTREAFYGMNNGEVDDNRYRNVQTEQQRSGQYATLMQDQFRQCPPLVNVPSEQAVNATPVGELDEVILLQKQKQKQQEKEKEKEKDLAQREDLTNMVPHEKIANNSHQKTNTGNGCTGTVKVASQKKGQLGEISEQSGSSVDDNFPEETYIPKSVNSSPAGDIGLCLTFSPGAEGDPSCPKTSLVCLSESKKNRLSNVRALMRRVSLAAPSSDEKEEKPRRKKHRPKVRRDPKLDLKKRKKHEKKDGKDSKTDETMEDQVLASEVTEVDKLQQHDSDAHVGNPSEKQFRPRNESQTVSDAGNESQPDGLDLHLSIRVGSESSTQSSAGKESVVPQYIVSPHLGFLPILQHSRVSPLNEKMNWRVTNSEFNETCTRAPSLELGSHGNAWRNQCEDALTEQTMNLSSITSGNDWDGGVNGSRQSNIMNIPYHPCSSIAGSCKELALFPQHNELVLSKQEAAMSSCLVSLNGLSTDSKKKSKKKSMASSDELQLVPYNSKRDLIPYMGKRGLKKYRARVPIDQETNRVWLLLENGRLLPEESDEIKARQWREERDRLSSRVDSFLTTMHHFQGNRRFSKWKGSVVDSVVGAFLTQNVSDHLSSSAFMCLASKYPAVPKDEVHSTVGNEANGRSLIPIISDDDQCTITETTVACSDFNEKSFNAPHTCPERDSMSMANPFENDSFVGSPMEPKSDQTHAYTSFRSNIYAGNSARRRLDFGKPTASNEKNQTAEVETTTAYNNGQNASPTDSNCLEIGSNKLSNEGKTGLLDDCLIGSYPDVDRALQLVQQQESASVILAPGNTGNAGSSLEVIQKEDASAILPSGGKRKDYSLSRMTGVERARIEASQGGRKTGLRRSKRDWEALRRSALGLSDIHDGDGGAKNQREQERGPDQQDAINWEAILNADVAEVANTIKERGMHFILAGRIKAFLTTIKKEHGSLDLEWLRTIPMEDAKEFISDVRGLGVKSGECIRLLTLEHRAFPVDTNVGRICVRLGWVPIEPLPEELQLHLLEMYPIQESIQKYLWPRLCEFDQRTLYELHYQLITFGKVFCTKSKPNCNACPMRTECRHFASAYASAKPLIKGAADADNSQTNDLPALPASEIDSERALLISDFQRTHSSTHHQTQCCEPIVEFPPSPEHDYIDYEDIEDFYYIDNYDNGTEEGEFRSRAMSYQISSDGMIEMDNNTDSCNGIFSPSLLHAFQRPLSKHDNPLVDLIPESLLGLKTKVSSTQTQICEPNPIPDVPMSQITEIHSSDLAVEAPSAESQGIITQITSNALVPLSLENAYIPAPKLKNVQRLRTIHYVYEIPDDHFLLREMDKREEDDPCFYLLAIWSSDEVPQSQEEIDEYCKDKSSTAPVKDMTGNDEFVKGTLLIPCRTAMHGSFPLNGTYFQVNEVFADHATSVAPLEVPRFWLWSLQRRFVYFGTSVTTIFRGLTLEETRRCFWQGYICVRGFEQKTRAPKPLVARLHFPISKQPKITKKSIAKVPKST